MPLDLTDAMDRLYLETIPCRPTPPRGCHNGPTAQWQAHERDLWQLVNEITPIEIEDWVA